MKHLLRHFLTTAEGAMMIIAEASSKSWRYQEVYRFK